MRCVPSLAVIASAFRRRRAGARQIAGRRANVRRSAKCLPRARVLGEFSRSAALAHSLSRSLGQGVMEGCINNRRNLQRPKSWPGRDAAEKKRAAWLMTEQRRCAFPAKNEHPPECVCVHRVNVLERCLCMPKPRARVNSQPPESIKTHGEEIQFDVRLSFSFALGSVSPVEWKTTRHLFARHRGRSIKFYALSWEKRARSRDQPNIFASPQKHALKKLAGFFLACLRWVAF